MTAESRSELVELIKSASEEDRRAVASWLATHDGGGAWPWAPPSDIAGRLARYENEHTDDRPQLLKFRLSVSSYVRFQDWCRSNRLPMATALRGLVEMLLAQVAE
jgi:hypothetical protein